jgi:hypothetical protein
VLGEPVQLDLERGLEVARTVTQFGEFSLEQRNPATKPSDLEGGR